MWGLLLRVEVCREPAAECGIGRGSAGHAGSGDVAHLLGDGGYQPRACRCGCPHLLHPLPRLRQRCSAPGAAAALEPLPLPGCAFPGQHAGCGAVSSQLALRDPVGAEGTGLVGRAAHLAGGGLHLWLCSATRWSEPRRCLDRCRSFRFQRFPGWAGGACQPTQRGGVVADAAVALRCWPFRRGE